LGVGSLSFTITPMTPAAVLKRPWLNAATRLQRMDLPAQTGGFVSQHSLNDASESAAFKELPVVRLGHQA
jgi:hypothetical protein